MREITRSIFALIKARTQVSSTSSPVVDFLLLNDNQAEFIKIPGWTISGHSVKRKRFLWVSEPILTRGSRYNTARELKDKQDQFCEKVLAGDHRTLLTSTFPQDLKWESLVDVLRGRVKVRIRF